MICLDGVSYTYPFQERPAIAGIDLSVRPGEAVLITGASGCGKSTLIRLINGLCPHFFKGRLSGRVRVKGVDNTERELGMIAADVGTLFQDPEHQFFAMTVGDEIAFAHEWREATQAAVRERVDRAAARFNLTPLLDRSLHGLSEGQKQKTALASIISQEPLALVLDEPTANLDPESTLELAAHIRALKRSGMAVVIVDHRLYWLESVVDRAVVMDRGRILAKGDFSILADEGLRAAAGLRRTRVTDPRARLPATGGEGPVRVDGLRFAYRGGPEIFDGASFSLPRGVTGLLGDNGVGKTTLARLLTGLSRMTSGRLSIRGEPTTPRRLLDRASIVLQNADHQLYTKTARDEILSSAHRVPKDRRAKTARKTLADFGLSEMADRHPQSLSGGEKQRLVIACGMVKGPEILILDEPTSGLDGRNMRLISQAIRRAADRGACVLLITHDLELIDSACDYALRLPFVETRKWEDAEKR
ncbi:MAG: ABC transporter ATP-binding protein [Thermodesulfobacteriota bacterium]